ncbi:MAG: adenylate/guanylate cyclase domain-containing protein [Verrucomicrobiota bacterium]
MTSTTFTLWKRWRKSVACLVGIAVVMLGFGVSPYGRVLIERSDRAFGDWIVRVSGGPPERRDLVLLGIDEDSQKLDAPDPTEIAANPTLSLMKQRFPWDRRVWARAIDRLADAGARLIVLDLIFSEPSEPEADKALGEALQRHADKVILGSVFSPAGADNKGEGFRLLEPAEEFVFGAQEIRSGYVNFYKDPVDDLVRSARYTTTLSIENREPRRVGEPEFRSLAAEVIHAMGAEVPSGIRELRFSRRVETGPADIYSPKSIYGIFSDKEWKNNYENGGFFRDKVVLIGPVAARFQDMHNTPMGPVAGPQLHLQAIACGLNEVFIRRLTDPWPGMILLGVVALAWTRWVSRPLVSVFGLMAIIASVAGLAVWAGVAHSVLLPVSGGLLALGSGWAVAQSYEMVTERLEKLRLRRDFRRFVSRDVADAMIAQQDEWRETAAGVKRRVVVLFSDVRGFTERSEQTDPGDLVKQLNEYLTSMVEVIFRHGGTLDKFIGDAVMAHWGALGGGSDEDHARKALLAARDMIAVLARMNASWQAAGKAPFQIGVGLHLGEAVAGEIGSPDRTEFGVIGDTVNLASRLEGLTKTFHCEVIYSDEVREASRMNDGALDLGLVRVKGRRNPVRLFGTGDEEVVREHLKSLERDADGVILMTVK